MLELLASARSAKFDLKKACGELESRLSAAREIKQHTMAPTYSEESADWDRLQKLQADPKHQTHRRGP